jgi:hypothetical protein
MYIKEVKKNNTPNGKVFYQYQLSETYRVDGKVKQKAILYLGTNELLKNKDNRTIVANLLEKKIKNEQILSDDFLTESLALNQLAEHYYSCFLQKRQKESQENVPDESTEKANNKVYDEVDLDTTQVFDCREIGTEWMCYEMLNRLGLKEFLEYKGWNTQKTDNALISIISRAIASYSEYKTESWLDLNSGLTELFEKKPGSISRHDLYRASTNLYDLKSELEEYFYNKMTTLFDLDDSILIYDLTNTYFEGRKLHSKIAKYGRNKQKRNDCKQVVLAAVINKDGFLKHSNIYSGNMSDPVTLIDIISKMSNPGISTDKQPLIVIDAGIATEDNLEMLRSKGYLYVCVSRSKPHKDYETDTANAIIIKDKRENEIKLKYMDTKDSKDKWVYVKSSNKTKKEDSMLFRSMDNFELEMSSVRSGISKKGGTKKAEKVWERIGRIKERNRSVHKYYDIKVEVKDGTAVEVEYTKKEIESEDKQSGEYYLRTNYTLASEEEIWDIYNTIREVESTFRCLKTDLRLRPVHHQEDRYCEAHLHLGLLAYQIVAPIRYMLKKAGIDYGWRNIVRIMNTQKVVSISIANKEKNEVFIKICSRPKQEVLEIYRALQMSSMPFKSKKFVVHH